jgi:hypothetical protein
MSQHGIGYCRISERKKEKKGICNKENRYKNEEKNIFWVVIGFCRTPYLSR